MRRYQKGQEELRTKKTEEASKNYEKVAICDEIPIRLVIIGHVDHGKSTIIGRLLADTNSLPEGKLDKIRKYCEKNEKPFEYAFLLDALKEEQSQGITIDLARCFFQTQMRKYLIYDAPGHVDFLKNMVTGAASADAALLVIDALEGIKENTRRHVFFLSLLQVQHLIVLVNKMDLVDYSQKRFDEIVTTANAFFHSIHIHPTSFIPISARKGLNLRQLSQEMPWYTNTHLVQELDAIPHAKSAHEKPLRILVQDIYKFHESKRIIAGKIETGTVSVKDRLVIFPSNQTSVVKTMECVSSEKKTKSAGSSVGITLEDDFFVQRGDVLCKESEKKPYIAKNIRARVFWLGKKPLTKRCAYKIKLGCATTECYITNFDKIIDSSSLSVLDKNTVSTNEVAELSLSLLHPFPFDPFDELFETSRFVLIDQYTVAGGGIILEAVQEFKESPGQKSTVCFIDGDDDETTENEFWVLGKRPLVLNASEGYTIKELEKIAALLEGYGILLLVRGASKREKAVFSNYIKQDQVKR